VLVEKYKMEILETERAFAQLAKDQGLKVAFSTYASDEAVLHRANKLIKGKQAIAEYFEQQTLQNVRLEWVPDFVSVAASGDLGYTYGKFNFEGTDEKGEEVKIEGIFHTIWKREANGEWRYVWD
jgi:ketosteroid isomerase-like protein